MVKQSLVDFFIKEIYFKTAMKNNEKNETVVKHIDSTWSLNLVDMIDSGVNNNKGYRFIFVVLDHFSFYGWAISLKGKTFWGIISFFWFSIQI